MQIRCCGEFSNQLFQKPSSCLRKPYDVKDVMEQYSQGNTNMIVRMKVNEKETKRILIIIAGAPTAARPDDWEAGQFSGIDIADIASDFDSDGFLDVSEYRAGTDPKDNDSYLHFKTPIEVKNKTVVLRWKSVPGRRYRIEKSNGDPTAWKPLNKGVTARLDAMEHIDLRIDNGRPVFYRLVVEPQ